MQLLVARADAAAAPDRRRPSPRQPRPTLDAGADAGREPAAVAPARPHSLEIRNPATGEVIRSVAVTEAGEIDQKVARARGARSRRGRRVRSPSGPRSLRAFRDLLEREAEECAQLTTSEVGKPIRQSRNEVRAVLERIDWNIAHVGRGRSRRGRSRATAALEERITYEPVGVVAHVSAWNYPYFVGAQLDRARAARRERRAATSRRSTPRSPGCGSSI